MARTSHHGLHNDMAGFHECAVHEGCSGVKGCGPFTLHSPSVGLPGGYQVFDSLQKKEEEIRSRLGRVLPAHLQNIPRYLLYGIWPTVTLSGPFVDLLKTEENGTLCPTVISPANPCICAYRWGHTGRFLSPEELSPISLWFILPGFSDFLFYSMS